MLTGGFRTRAEVDAALAPASARSSAWAGRSRSGPTSRGASSAVRPTSSTGPAPRLGGPALVQRMLGAAAGTGWHRIQLVRTADGEPPLLRVPALVAGLDYTVVDGVQALLGRRARMKLAA